jgi:thiamine-monophosphate kinase
VKLNALIDLSDGLASDAAHIAAASSVALRLETGFLPVHPSARTQPEGLRLAAAGGDDYELCLVAPAGALGKVKREFEQQFQLRLTRIGTVEPGAGVIWLDDNGRPLEGPLKGFDHFDRHG